MFTACLGSSFKKKKNKSSMQFPFWSWLIASPHAFPGERLKHGAIKPWPVFRWFNDYNNKVVPWLCSMLPSSVVWCSMAAIKKGVKDEKDVFPNVYPGECSERNMHVCVHLRRGRRFTGCRSIDELLHQDVSTSTWNLITQQLMINI